MDFSTEPSGQALISIFCAKINKNIVRAIKYRSLRWAEHVAKMEEGRNALQILTGGVIANEPNRIDSNSYEKVKTFKCLGSLLTNQNFS